MPEEPGAGYHRVGLFRMLRKHLRGVSDPIREKIYGDIRARADVHKLLRRHWLLLANTGVTATGYLAFAQVPDGFVWNVHLVVFDLATGTWTSDGCAIQAPVEATRAYNWTRIEVQSPSVTRSAKQTDLWLPARSQVGLYVDAKTVNGTVNGLVQYTQMPYDLYLETAYASRLIEA